MNSAPQNYFYGSVSMDFYLEVQGDREKFMRFYELKLSLRLQRVLRAY
jgi:hypothetical protein